MTTTTSRALRYRLTLTIHQLRRAVTIAELVDLVRQTGIELDGRASKLMSDGLRTEVRRGRIVKLGRASYGPGRLPKSTASFMRSHVRTAEQGR